MALRFKLVLSTLLKGSADPLGCKNFCKMLRGLQGKLSAVKSQVRTRREVTAQVLQQIAVWGVLGAVTVDLQCMLAGQSVPLLESRAVNGVLDMGPWLLTAMGKTALTEWLASFTS